MSKITAIIPAKNKKNRVFVYLDGKLAGMLDDLSVKNKQYCVGEEISGPRLQFLQGQLEINRGLGTAYRIIKYRPRSEKEIRNRLQKHGFGDTQIDQVIEKLKEQHLLDDQKFAEFWTDQRTAFSPRSRWLVSRELGQKGIDKEIIEQAVGDIDEDSAAYDLAYKKAVKTNIDDYEIFRRRIGAFLQRRGFSYAVINRTVKTVWHDIKIKQ